MLKAIELGRLLPGHRSRNFLMEGRFDEVIFEDLPNIDAGGSVHDGEMAFDEACFKEVVPCLSS